LIENPIKCGRYCRNSILAIGIIALCAVPLLSGNLFWLDVASDMTIWAVLAVGLNAVLGWAGLLDLGFIAFFAIGGYGYAILSIHHIFNVGIAVVCVLAMSLIAAVIIGTPSVRVKSDYLAIMTLGFGEIVYLAAKNLTGLTGGVNGLFGYSALTIFGVSLDSNTDFYLIGLVLLTVTCIIGFLVRRSRLGRSWILVRDDELSARAAGIRVRRVKLLAYMYGSVWATLAGILFALKIGIVSPESFSFNQSFYVVVAVVIGGMGSIWGAALGGAVYIVISEALQGIDPTLSGLIYSGLVLLFILVRPDGLFPRRLFERLFNGLNYNSPNKAHILLYTQSFPGKT